MRKVTEEDFRMPEFRGKDPNDYEFRADGVVVRKDRWENAIRSIRYALGDRRIEFEVGDVVSAVQAMVALVPDPEEATGSDEDYEEYYNSPLIGKDNA